MTQTTGHSPPLQTAIQQALVDADDFYTLMIESGESPNIDSVGYTSQITLEVFRRLLKRPELAEAELEQLLRQARSEVRRRMGPREYVRVPRPMMAPDPDRDWSALMADIIVQNDNHHMDRPYRKRALHGGH